MGLFGRSAQRAEAEAYVEAALPRLTGLALAMTGNKADAEDLVQDTLARLLTRWSLVSDADNMDAYVRRTMVNTLASRKRLRFNTEVISHEVVTTDRPPRGSAQGGDVAAEVTDRDAVLNLVRQLPPRQRAAIALRFYEDLSDGEIAKALDCSVQAVRSAVHNALKTLRRQMPELVEQGVEL